ncbi:MAG: hypothetical protein LBH47_00915 [Christensenellaceae bacterium]|nr:hypothetical protein [Christensenellaceae bacterium]
MKNKFKGDDRTNRVLIHIDETHFYGMTVRKGINGSFTYDNSIIEEHSGIKDFEFIDEESWRATLDDIVKRVNLSNRGKDELLYLSVPDCFCEIEVKEYGIEGESQVITEKTIEELVRLIEEDFSEEEIIEIKTVYYNLDGGNEIFDEIIGKRARRIGGLFSVMTAKKEFCKAIPIYTVKQAGFSQVVLLNATSAELKFIPKKTRDDGVSIISSGFYSTTISSCKCNGVSQMDKLNFGVAHVIKDLVDNANVNYDEAVALLHASVISVERSITNNYVIGERNFSSAFINKIIKDNVTKIIDDVSRLKLFPNIYITGGNLFDIYSVKNMLMNKLGNNNIKALRDRLDGSGKYPDVAIKALLNNLTFGG